MTTHTQTPPTTEPASDWRHRADEAVAALGQRKDAWARLPIQAKIDHLRALPVNTAAQAQPQGALVLVLGAGNIASIAPLDVLYKLYAEGHVCLLKMNPVNEYLGPILEDIFRDLVTDGFVGFAYGSAEVGEYLTRHQGI